MEYLKGNYGGPPISKLIGMWKIYDLNREIHLCKHGFLSNEYNQNSNFQKTFSRNSIPDDFDDSVSCSISYRPVGLHQSLTYN